MEEKEMLISEIEERNTIIELLKNNPKEYIQSKINKINKILGDVSDEKPKKEGRISMKQNLLQIKNMLETEPESVIKERMKGLEALNLENKNHLKEIEDGDRN